MMPLGNKEREDYAALSPSKKKEKEKEGEDAKVKRKRRPRKKFEVADLPLGEGQIAYSLKEDLIGRKVDCTFGQLMNMVPKLKRQWKSLVNPEKEPKHGQFRVLAVGELPVDICPVVNAWHKGVAMGEAYIDGGAQVCVITQSCVKRLGLITYGSLGFRIRLANHAKVKCLGLIKDLEVEDDKSEVTSEDSFEDSESSTTSSSSDEADVAYLSKDECSLVQAEAACAMKKEVNINGSYKNELISMGGPIEECIGEINDDELEELMLMEACFSMEDKEANTCSEEEHVDEIMHELPLFDNGEEENLQNDAPKLEVERDENAVIDEFLAYLNEEESEDADDDIMKMVPYEKIQDMPFIEEDYNILSAPSQGCFIGLEIMQSCFLEKHAKQPFMNEAFVRYYPQQDITECIFVDNISHLKECNFELLDKNMYVNTFTTEGSYMVDRDIWKQSMFTENENNDSSLCNWDDMLKLMDAKRLDGGKRGRVHTSLYPADHE
ncbi:hypothetical protein L7F22_022481 [Adiantum nelumboides]|nr:hypothetical protein [Adiantum nelumboides]